MDYKLSEVHQKLKELSDKMGSDYFVLPVFLNFFETAAYDFIGEKLKIVEKTQEITDDIRPLMTTEDLVVTENINQPDSGYVSGLPSNYLRTVAYDIIYPGGERCRRADLLRQSHYLLSRNNPNKRPTKEYPIILQEGSIFRIDTGGVKPESLRLTYCKKPTFATTGQLTQRIINLPDDSIEKVLKITVTGLFNKTGDQRTQSNYQLQESYRKVFK